MRFPKQQNEKSLTVIVIYYATNIVADSVVAPIHGNPGSDHDYVR